MIRAPHTLGARRLSGASLLRGRAGVREQEPTRVGINACDFITDGGCGCTTRPNIDGCRRVTGHAAPRARRAGDVPPAEHHTRVSLSVCRNVPSVRVVPYDTSVIEASSALVGLRSGHAAMPVRHRSYATAAESKPPDFRRCKGCRLFVVRASRKRLVLPPTRPPDHYSHPGRQSHPARRNP